MKPKLSRMDHFKPKWTKMDPVKHGLEKVLRQVAQKVPKVQKMSKMSEKVRNGAEMSKSATFNKMC